MIDPATVTRELADMAVPGGTVAVHFARSGLTLRHITAARLRDDGLIEVSSQHPGRATAQRTVFAPGEIYGWVTWVQAPDDDTGMYA
jgi:hypothetical protein